MVFFSKHQWISFISFFLKIISIHFKDQEHTYLQNLIFSKDQRIKNVDLFYEEKHIQKLITSSKPLCDCFLRIKRPPNVFFSSFKLTSKQQATKRWFLKNQKTSLHKLLLRIKIPPNLDFFKLKLTSKIEFF